MTSSLTPQALGLKTEDPELPTDLPLLPLPHLNGCESIESNWSDDSPGMSDSLLSLDFNSANELGSSVLNSGSFSEASPQLVTPSSSMNQTLFSPLNGDMFSTDIKPSMPEHEFPQKRPCLERDRTSFSFTGPMMDFTLFPKEDEVNSVETPGASATLENTAQSSDVLHLLNTLNATKEQSTRSEAEPEALMTASLPAINNTMSSGCHTRGTRRRRRDADELLPIDAPIQPRTYHTESATSRRDSCGSVKSSSVSPREGQNSPKAPSTQSENNQEMDARSLKRLSNTLAARRSRHRKAEELKKLHDTIEGLQKEVAMWKKRCEDAERQRDQSWLMTSSTM